MPVLVEDVKLYIWKGDWGLASVDSDCLLFLTYLKFCGIDVETIKSNNPFKSPNGKLPVLYIGKELISSFEELKTFIDRKDLGIDNELHQRQRSEMIAYINLMREKLQPALRYIWWVDPKNHNGLTRPWYCRALPFPLNFYYPGKYQKEAENDIEALYEQILDVSDIETSLYSDAEKCLVTLSTRLGDGAFMLGPQPCSLDAVLYSLLAPLLTPPFPNKTLQNHLNNHANLRKYIVRISQTYFPADYKAYEDEKREEAKKYSASTEDFPNAKRNKFLAGIVAFASMIMYALATGIVKGPASIKPANDEYEEDEM